MCKRRSLLLIGVVLVFAACGGKKATIRDDVPPPWMKDLAVAPLGIQDIRVSESEGYHALLLKLTRFPDKIEHTATDSPARVRLVLGGPATGEDITEERVVTADSLVNAVRYSRQGGNVVVVVELSGEEPPPYSVREMADWVMVRFAREE